MDEIVNIVNIIPGNASALPGLQAALAGQCWTILLSLMLENEVELLWDG